MPPNILIPIRQWPIFVRLVMIIYNLWYHNKCYQAHNNPYYHQQYAYSLLCIFVASAFHHRYTIVLKYLKVNLIPRLLPIVALRLVATN